VTSVIGLAGRVSGKTVIVVGGGQTPGASVGNGRAAALLYGREGARVVVADRDLDSAEETAQLIRAAGGEACVALVDVQNEADLQMVCALAVTEFGSIDVLHYNVGIGRVGGDASVTEITADAFSQILDINLRGSVLASKHAVPVMRQQGAGAIINIASIAVRIDYPWVAYKTSKAGLVALTEHLAITNAKYGIRANTVVPGLMDTPMAVEYRIQEGVSREDVLADRAKKVPLKGRPGNAWDVANAALFLASDDAAFITGATLTVDGGQTLVVG
jgi:NAD(P)-dependent dehydrogenase (short-subunit alcohol dehydrogenase family)